MEWGGYVLCSELTKRTFFFPRPQKEGFLYSKKKKQRSVYVGTAGKLVKTAFISPTVQYYL